jgi:hypothetical protein
MLLVVRILHWKSNFKHSKKSSNSDTYTRKKVCNETNLMLYLSSVYWVTTPLHVLGLLVAHHQEVPMHICDIWYVLYVIVDLLGLDGMDPVPYTVYTLLPTDDGLLASPKHVEVEWLNKCKINSASSWFHYTHISRCTVKKQEKEREREKKNMGVVSICCQNSYVCHPVADINSFTCSFERTSWSYGYF